MKVVAGVKTCCRCGVEKAATLEEFPAERRVKDGLSSWCRACYREYGSRWQRELRRTQPERVRLTDRDQSLRKKYGMTAEDVDHMIDEQDGLCLTCGRQFSDSLPPRVDHCHKTGVVRGVLCGPCNVILGLANENPVRLRALAGYIDPIGSFSRCAVADMDEMKRWVQ